MRYALLLAIGLSASGAFAGSYYETVDGDLSGDRLNPTLFNVAIGQNQLAASSIAGDLEYFRIVVPVNAQLTQINQTAYQSSNSRAFLGVQQGTTFTVTPNTAEADDLLGYVHFGFDFFNADLLAPMGTAGGAIGFTPPLAAGNYTFWAQQIEPISAQYELSFVVTPVPEPSTWMLGFVGLIGLILFKSRLLRRTA